MAIPLDINGAVFEYPEDFNENWGVAATGWAQAVTNGMLQMQGGSFPLTADVNFGPNFGLLSKYFETRSTFPATTGTVRLSPADAGIAWRNNAHGGNLVLTTDASDNLLFNGNPIASSGGGAVTSITGTANQIIASSATGAVTLSTPQSIAPASSPTFAGLTLSAPLTVPNGGTGVSSLTAYAVLTGGTTSTSPIQSVASVGLAGQVLTSNGAGALPSFANTTGSGTVNSGTSGNIAYYATSSAAVSDALIARANLFLADGSVAATGAFNLNSHKITSLTQGTTTGDAVAFPVAAAQIANNTITATQIANTTITATQIANATITTTQVASDTLTGSSANSGGSAGNIDQGTISTPDFRSGAVTDIQTSADTGAIAGTDTTATSVTITTLGFPVLIVASLTAGSGVGAITFSAKVLRGTTAFNGNRAQAYTGAAGQDATATIVAVDTPTAGTYTYNLKYVTALTTLAHYSLVAIELRA